MLFRQVADRRVEVAPGARCIGEGRAVLLVLAFHFGARVLITAHDWRELKEIADENGLQSAKRVIRFANELTDLADRGQGLPRQHRNLIDDENARLLDPVGHATAFRDRVHVRAADV